MLLFEDQIEKAESRASFDLAAAIAAMQDKTPGEVSHDARASAARSNFLRETLDSAKDATKVFERILQGNELQPVNYLERGAIAARAIARIDIRSAAGGRVGWGTGFLIAPNVLITNNHVLPDATTATASKAHLSYELNLADEEAGPIVFDLDATALFYTSKALDFTVVAVAPRSTNGATGLAPFGFLPLLDVSGKAMEGEWLTIVQHPSGELKQLCVRENRLIKRDDDVLWYSTDTLPGSSGSPVFNNDWFVVALHHSGVPQREHGEFKTVDGSRYVSGVTKEIQVKWIANEGIRASRIAQTLKSDLPQHPLLQPLFNATPASARITRRASGHEPPPLHPPKAPVMSANVNFPLRRCVEISSDGNIRIIGDCGTGTSESMDVLEKKTSKRRAANFDAPFDSDYTKRKGYNAGFLGAGAKRVALPKLSKALEAVAVPLSGVTPQEFVLKYDNYSLVMHAERKLAIYSAANVNFDNRFEMSRPPDVWRTDPRIPDKYQLKNWYYQKNNFDRGHLTRREDLEFGKTRADALQSAADTCHWTNCTPQHSKFNQNKEIWQGLELYILESTIEKGEFNAQVITGPIFDQEDPDYKGVPYPLQYWKVVAAINDDDKLFATAYIASQEDVIDKYGVEAAVPFGPYKTFQVKIADVERLTGLTFMCGVNDATSLSEHDPLKANPPRRRRARRPGASEAAAMRDFGRYEEIQELEDIHLTLPTR